MNSQIQISGILGSGATQRRSQGNQERDKQARETRKKKQAPEEEVGRYRSSSVTPDSQPNVLSFVRGIRRELVTLFLTIKR